MQTCGYIGQLSGLARMNDFVCASQSVLTTFPSISDTFISCGLSLCLCFLASFCMSHSIMYACTCILCVNVGEGRWEILCSVYRLFHNMNSISCQGPALQESVQAGSVIHRVLSN